MKFPLIQSLLLIATMVSAVAQNTPATAPAPAAANPLVLSIDAWKTGPPFSFVYAGKPSASLLPTWQRTEETAPSDGGEVHRITWIDSATQLKVVAEVRTFTDYPALDWVVTFTNDGKSDTPIIDQIEALDWTRPAPATQPEYESWYGGNGGGDDFNPGQRDLDGNPANPAKLNNVFGRSARGTLPYFNFLDATYNGSGLDYGPGGVMVAIGWTGSWLATIAEDASAKTVHFVAGMPKTHLLLHAGETIRSPRIVELCWTGDRQEAPSQWRRLMLHFYTPHSLASGSTALPALFAGGGGTSEARVTQIKQLGDVKIKFDLYGLAGWAKQRGTWTPDPASFPAGLKPLGDTVHAAGMGVMLNMEPEVADAGSDWLKQHPDWYLPGTGDQPALLDFGNAAARKAISDLASQLITDSGATWFHHAISDYKMDEAWGANDKPDRVGMTEINHITGLYAFWDELQKEHPGLLIDQPGSRVDIEALRRGGEIWGTTYGQPLINQQQIEQLLKWVPITSGLFYTTPPDLPPTPAMQLYVWRGSYGPGWAVSAPLPIDGTFAPVLEEYRRAQPFFLGDFYPLNLPDSTPQSGVAVQYHRPDLKAGMVIVLRREKCPYTAIQPMLKAIDPGASYDVEIRHTLAPGTIEHMTGKELAAIQIPVPEKPDSLILFYKQH
jgi:alpha-galactosidase